ncbi:hypothetical protein [Lacinutrix salivirga]
MRTNRKYTRELYRQFRYYPSWLPGTPFNLGDVGILRGKEFIRQGNLTEEGIDFDILKDETKVDLSHSSKGAVSITFKASGTAPAVGSTLSKAKAGISVSFSKENSILMKAKGTLNHSIKDQRKLARTIMKLYEEGKWNKDLLVITELVVADSATILIANSKESKIELSAGADVSLAKLDIANGEIELGTTISKDLHTEIVAKEGITPLFRLSKVQTPFLGRSRFETTKMSKEYTDSGITGIDLNLEYFGEFDETDDYPDFEE